MFRRVRISGRRLCLVFVVMLWVASADAQLEVGDNVKMNLTGNLGYGYSGASGNTDISSHGQGFTGNADLTGYYFHPNFLSFEVHPYYDRNQSNSDSQSITRATGIGASIGLFSGSHFPGSISYGRDFSTNSEFQIAGVPSVIGDSSGQNLGISWSMLLPKLPQFQASYSIGSTSASLTDSVLDSESKSRNLNLSSSYQLVGFNLHGNFSHTNSHYASAGILTPEAIDSDSSGTNYGLSAQHSLPLHGSFNLGWGHSSSDSSYGYGYSSNAYTASVGILPWQRLSLNQTVTYTTNLSALLGQSIIGPGGISALRSDYVSDALNLGTSATLSVGHGLSINGHMNHRQQTYAGTEYSDTQFGGTLNYNYRSPLFGFLYLGFGVVDSASENGNEGMGIVANVGMSKRLGRWETTADFDYAQNVQTQIIIVTTSSYSYGTSVRRRINRDTNFGVSFRGSHSGLTMQEGNSSRSESFNSQFNWRRYGFSASYSQASGTAVLNSNGSLTAAPLGFLITDDFLYFNARSLSFSVSTRLSRNLSATGGYVDVYNSSKQSLFGNVNSGQRYNARMEYRLRKFSLMGGFNRSTQDLSALAGPPRVVNSYYLSLTRWFNVF